MKSFIILENIKIYAYHGVSEQEQAVGQLFILNLKIEMGDNNMSSMRSDEIEDTISYADVFDIVKTEMKIKSKLLENVGYRIMNILKEKYPNVLSIELKITKQTPPISGIMGQAGILLKVSK